MAEIKTLGDVVDFIGQYASSMQASPVSPVAAPAVLSDASGAVSPPVGIDFKEMLLDVVADKTGYPKEILSLEMDLEVDLGIDSIKRVEIFSAINEDNPWIPEVDPAVMAEIKTLGDVVDFIGQYASSMQASPVSPVAAPAVLSDASGAVSPPVGIDFKEMLLDVVADKTGYPKEILSLEMDLEVDLGIDSIKRVEIFSAINEDNPWIPEVDPAVMAEIKTLGDVVDFIGQYASSMQASPVSPVAAPAVLSDASGAVSPPVGIDFKEMLLDVVADKTGYPKEILSLEMDLEVDLGIDSIKRVEIFSAINEDNPWIPEVDPAVMAEIKTLGDVVDFIGQYASSMQASPVSPVAAPAVLSDASGAVSPPVGIDFKEMLLDVVADKTDIQRKFYPLKWILRLISALTPSNVLKFFPPSTKTIRGFRKWIRRSWLKSKHSVMLLTLSVNMHLQCRLHPFLRLLPQQFCLMRQELFRRPWGLILRRCFWTW